MIHNNNIEGYSGTNMCQSNLTSGYIQQCEREKYCPRDGKKFEAGDVYCSKCGRAIGFIAENWIPPYTLTWGQQTAPNTGVSWNTASQQLQQNLDFCGNSDYNGT